MEQFGRPFALTMNTEIAATSACGSLRSVWPPPARSPGPPLDTCARWWWPLHRGKRARPGRQPACSARGPRRQQARPLPRVSGPDRSFTHRCCKDTLNAKSSEASNAVHAQHSAAQRVQSATRSGRVMEAPARAGPRRGRRSCSGGSGRGGGRAGEPWLKRPPRTNAPAGWLALVIVYRAAPGLRKLDLRATAAARRAAIRTRTRTRRRCRRGCGSASRSARCRGTARSAGRRRGTRPSGAGTA